MSQNKIKYFVSVESTGMAGKPNRQFTYLANQDLIPKIGQIYKIAFGKRQVLGIVRSISTQKPADNYTVKKLGQAINLSAPIPKYYLELADWINKYYNASARAVWSCMLPTGLSAASKLKSNKTPDAELTPINTLSPDQNKAMRIINKNSVTLLHGITGSGKTEVYLHAISNMLNKNKSTILLVPEIMLTTQLELRLKQHFKTVYVLHSGLSAAYRKKLWIECLNRSQTEPIVILGPRSALFTPLNNLGLIIVDEEHEPSYKQESSPRYEAQLVAARMAKLTKSKLILGSATPSLRSFHLAKIRRIGYAQLQTRHNSILPSVKIIDMKLQPNEIISSELNQAITHNLKAKKQTLLFLNRRGSAHALICNTCGATNKCPRCDISLSFHADIGKLVCHYCDYKISPPAVCQTCGSTELRFMGDGIKKLENEITLQWPNARIARIDKDQSDYKYLQSTYKLLKTGQIDILLGTQMISRGLDIEKLTLVGIINADLSLNIPDYSAGERTFQLLSQTAGRAGRRHEVGEVIIQTRNPQNPIIIAASQHDYNYYFELESANRLKYTYPPFCYLLKLNYEHRNSAKAMQLAHELKTVIGQKSHIVVLGPIIQFRRTVKSEYIIQLVIKSKSRAVLVEIANSLPTGWTADLDPINLF